MRVVVADEGEHVLLDGAQRVLYRSAHIGTFTGDDDALLAVASGSGRFGLLDIDGKWALKPMCDALQAYTGGGTAACRRGEHWGIVALDGGWQLEPVYLEVTRPHQGRVTVRDAGGWHILDAGSGEVVAGPFEDASFFMGGVSIVSVDGRVGLLAPDGTWLLPPSCEDLIPMSDAQRFFASGCVERGRGWVAADGRWLGNADYELGLPGSQWATGSTLEGRQLVVRLSDLSVTEHDWMYIRVDEHSDRLSMLVDERWGLADMAGAVLVAPRSLEPIVLRGDRLVVHEESGPVLCDSTGAPIRELAHVAEVLPFVGPVAPARVGEAWGLLDRHGDWAIEPRFEAIEDLFLLSEGPTR
jgi:hypothetical protein